MLQAAARVRPAAGVVAAAVFSLGCVEPIAFMVRNHPHEIVYFNPLAGGPRRALLRFDLDYWGNCLVEAGRWCDDLARRAGVPLAVAGNPNEILVAEIPRHSALYAPPASARIHHLHVVLLGGVGRNSRKRSSAATPSTSCGWPTAPRSRSSSPVLDSPEVAARLRPFLAQDPP